MTDYKIEYDYALRRLGSAVRCLAVGEKDVKSRLRVAYLAIQTLHPRYLPEELHADLEWVFSELTKFDPEPDWRGRVWEGQVAATLRRRKNKTLKRVAERIVEMHERLMNHYIYGFDFSDPKTRDRDSDAF